MVSRSDGLLHSIGQGFSHLDAQAWRDALDGLAVESGLGVTPASSGLAVDVASGTATHGESSGSVVTSTLGSSTQVTLDAADSTNPRKDTIYITSGGTVDSVTGTAEPAAPSGNDRFDTYSPEPPATPNTDDVILAEVWVAAGASTLATADIRDRRVPATTVADTLVSRSLSTDEIDTSRTWQDVVSSRSLDTQYTNSTNGEISAIIILEVSADATDVGFRIDVDGSQIDRIDTADNSPFDTGRQLTFQATDIPAGATYSTTTFRDTADFTLRQWREFRP